MIRMGLFGPKVAAMPCSDTIFINIHRYLECRTPRVCQESGPFFSLLGLRHAMDNGKNLSRLRRGIV